MADRDDKDSEKSETATKSEPPKAEAKAKDEPKKVESKEKKDEPKEKVAAKAKDEPKAKSKDGEKKKTGDKPKSAAKPKGESKPKTEAARDRAEDVPASRGGLMWLFVIGAVALGGWWLWRGRDTGTTESATPSATPEPPPEPAVEQPFQAPTMPRPVEPTAEPTASAAPSAAPSATQAASAETPPPAGGGGEFDRVAAMGAVAKSGAKAAGCRMRGENPGTVKVAVTFDPSGSVKDSRVASGPYVGSGTGKCVLSRIADTKIAPFSGEAHEVIVPIVVN
jgi:hypothetical protein